MKFTHMSRDIGGEPISAMPLRQGFINLETPSVITSPRIVYCVSAGDLTLTWYDGNTDTISMFDGDSFAIDLCKTASIVSGTFHFVGKSVA